MRVTTNTFPTSLVNQLNKLLERQNRTQNEVATGQRIALPGDDPASMRRVLSLKAEASSLAQYQRNITTLKEQSLASYQALHGLKKVSNRAGEIATLADATKPPAELKLLAQEVTQLIQQAAQLANGRHRGEYLFAGTRTDNPPFTVTTDAEGWVTQVAYHGNASVAQAEIGRNDLVTAQIPGANATGSGPRGLMSDSRAGADFFGHLIALQNHLREGDIRQIAQTDRANLGQDEDHLIHHLANQGTLQTRLEAVASFASQKSFELEKAVSQETEVDLAQTIMRLNATQTAYQAALQSGAAMLNRSLMDYLR